MKKKTITPQSALQDALAENVRDIALIEPDPQDWGGWVIYLLEQMEGEAQRRGNTENFEEMFKSLRGELGI